jgi:integrase
MFNLAERWGLRPDGSNPCRHVDRYPERRRERYLAGSELGRLGEALDEAEQTGEEPAAAVAALRLLLFTGCRRGEILNLSWGEVDFEYRCLRLKDSKTGPKLVPLNPPALGVLEQLARRRGPSPWVVEGARQGRNFVGLHRVWDRVRKQAGIEDVRIHDLRHSFASFGASAGMGLPLLGALLGHRAAATTARYAHLHTAPLRAASEEIGARIAAALAGDRRTDREGMTPAWRGGTVPE